MPEPPHRLVGRGYDALGSRYRDRFSASPVRRAQVDALLRRLPAGSTVVDLGCGPGEPATRLLTRRHRVVGVDLSEVQLGWPGRQPRRPRSSGRT
jgi:SAM-dependent methyltransferase